MRELAIITPWRSIAIVSILGTWFATFNFSQFMGRLASPPSDYAGLASFQLQMGIFPFALATALAAWSTSRFLRGSVAILWLTSSTSVARRTLTIQAGAAFPSAAAWIIFWLATTLIFGHGPRLAIALSVVPIGVANVLVGAAFGQGLAYVLPFWLATPIATTLGYMVPAVGNALSDDRWWQILSPGLGGDIPGSLAAVWAAGATLWFIGLWGVLSGASSSLSAVPRRFPTAVVAAGALAVVVGGLIVRAVAL